MGWRIGVYWKDDQKFYYGEVVSFDASTGRSMVVYTDGAHHAHILKHLTAFVPCSTSASALLPAWSHHRLHIEAMLAV